MDRQKYVDESWKETASIQKEKLKEVAGQPSPRPQARPETSDNPQISSPETSASGTSKSNIPTDPVLLNYLSGLGYQALIFLGEIPHPGTGESELNLEQAKFVIDTLAMLRDKTQGNLSKEEENMLNGSVYELQMKYVEANKKEGQPS